MIKITKLNKILIIILILLLISINIVNNSSAFFADIEGRLTNINKHDSLSLINKINEDKSIVYCIGINKDYTVDKEDHEICFQNKEIRDDVYQDLVKQMIDRFGMSKPDNEVHKNTDIHIERK